MLRLLFGNAGTIMKTSQAGAAGGLEIVIVAMLLPQPTANQPQKHHCLADLQLTADTEEGQDETQIAQLIPA